MSGTVDSLSRGARCLPRLGWVLGLLLALAAQSCAVVGAVVLAPVYVALELGCDPAPTIAVEESPELLEEVHGSLVVASGRDHLTVVEFPGGVVREVPVRGTALGASGIDAQGRVAYVRRRFPWYVVVSILATTLGEPTYELRVLSLATGEDRLLAEVRARYEHGHVVSLGTRRVAYQVGGRRPRVVDLDTGAELDSSWIPRGSDLIELGPDDERLFAWDARAEAEGGRPAVVVLDLAKRKTRAPRPSELTGVRYGWDSLDGAKQSARERTSEELPGALPMPTKCIADRLVLYEGLASPEDGARERLGLMYPSFEHSIRLGEPTARRTVTLVPRFTSGTWVFSRNPVPSSGAPTTRMAGAP